MPINIPVRKGLKARSLIENRPELTPKEAARLAGTSTGAVVAALKRDHFGRDKPKSRAT